MNIVKSICALVTVGMLLGGCMLFDVKEQQEKIDAFCVFDGSVTTVSAEPQSIIALLLRQSPISDDAPRGWRIVDHFVMEQPGRWRFQANDGVYRVAALADTNGDLKYQRGEAYAASSADKPFHCTTGGRFTDVALNIPATSPPLDTEFDVASMVARSIDEQTYKTLGQLTVAGEVVTLDDPRFAMEYAADSLWHPFDTVMVSPPGVYFLEAYDPKKIPVLFVHGMTDSPARFKYLISQLDRKRFQPWVYAYPSGVHLAAVADNLTQVMTKLQVRYHVERIAIVCHSMGGLVSRGYLLRKAADPHAIKVPLFVSVSTPWDGHKAAASGVKHAPTAVRVWYDMAPGSEYIQSLFAQPLPAEVQHHLVFTFQRDSSSFGESDDQSVTVASELSEAAQKEATRLHGFNKSHTGVLASTEMAALLNQLLEQNY